MRSIAFVEIAKGLLALAAACGVLSLRHTDLHAAAFAFYSAEILLHGAGRGWMLLAFGIAYAALGAVLYRVRDLGAIVIVLALAVGAVGTADILSHGSLTYVWAAETVVLACGMYTTDVAALAGVNVPIVPMAHQYVITKPMEGHSLESYPRL